MWTLSSNTLLLEGETGEQQESIKAQKAEWVVLEGHLQNEAFGLRLGRCKGASRDSDGVEVEDGVTQSRSNLPTPLFLTAFGPSVPKRHLISTKHAGHTWKS